MRNAKVYPIDVLQSCTALQLAVYEHMGRVESNQTDEQMLQNMRLCAEGVLKQVQKLIKQERE